MSLRILKAKCQTNVRGPLVTLAITQSFFITNMRFIFLYLLYRGRTIGNALNGQK